MTRRKKNSGLIPTLKTIVTIAVALLVACSFAYTTCTKDSTNRRLSQLASTDDEWRLAEVGNFRVDDAALLHYPGFDVMFSAEHHQPYYVAWVLTPEHARATAAKRSDNFRPDPDVDGSAQLSDYRRSGYDRGHMAPSADFKYSEEAQQATFFLTNICPQDNSLNAGAWARLEEQCRSWAQRDSTLVIVAGPILNDRLTQTIGETQVTVPSRFFKVVLAPYANPPRAIGFIMPNTYVEGGVQATAMSVDQVEEITGYDFFGYLPDEIEDSLEAVGEYHKWQYAKKKKKK